MDISTVNFYAVIAAAISRFALGALWYSPISFGDLWMRSAGITHESVQQANPVKTFGFALLASLIIAFTLALFLPSDLTLLSASLHGFLVGFSWVAMSLAVNDLFEQRPFKLFLINAGYHTVSFTIMAAIIGAWY
jgi:hypothetical protein